MDLQKKVRKEIAIGVLAGGLFVTLIIWYLAYTQQKADAFTNLTVPAEYLE